MPLHSGRRIRYIPEVYETPQRKRFRAIKFLGRIGYNVGSAIAQDAKKFPLPNYGDAGAALLSGAIHKLSDSAPNAKMPSFRGAQKERLTHHMDVESTPSKRSHSEMVAGSGTSSSNMSSMTSGTVSRVMKGITSMAELDAHKRSGTAKYRLHAAKYLRMDAMLKELMFPLHRFRGFFGFVQTSGQGLNVAVPGTTGDLNKLAPRSSFRSISFFKLRHTKPRTLPNYPAATEADQAKVLNATRVKIGTTTFTATGAAEAVQTYFRRFANTPLASVAPNGAGIPPNTEPAGVMTMSDAPGHYRQLALDYNCADMERAALQESSFFPNPTGNTTEGGPAAEGADWATPSSGPNFYKGDNADQVYLNNTWSDAVMRIVDGKLTMDVTNGTRVPTVCELVIHSMKKNTPGTNKIMNTTQIYESIWKACNYQASEATAYKTTNVPGNPVGSPQGGWNAFWDPKTPFLKCKGPAKKMVDDLANEVHRSVHYIGPGESKTIEIALGSLYYKLGHRSGFYDPGSGAPVQDTQKVNILEDGPGTLAVALGAFGIDCLETAWGNDIEATLNQTGQSNALEGAGFWVGKSPAPSSLVVSGKYEEAWYPSYFNRKQRQIGDVHGALCSVVGENYYSVPKASIAPTQVSSIDGSSYFESIGGGAAPENTQN